MHLSTRTSLHLSPSYCHPAQEDMTEGRARYYREVEVKHGRVAMLGALGFLVGEGFHPLFGGNIDVPSYVAFQASPLQDFWPGVVATIGVFEFFSIVQIDGGFEVRDKFDNGETRIAGDFAFDPLGFKPKDPKALEEMQTKVREGFFACETPGTCKPPDCA